MDSKYFLLLLVINKWTNGVFTVHSISAAYKEKAIMGIYGAARSVGLVTGLGNELVDMEKEVTFWCYLPGDRQYSQTFVNDENIERKIDFKKPVNFVIHGYTQSFKGGMKHNYQLTGNHFDSNWVDDLATDWSKYAMENVCVVDWSNLALFDYLVSAKVQGPKVAAYMKVFLDFLILQGVILQMVSVVGHSLGSHLAGFFGALYFGKLKAIYSIDAAGPAFTTPTVVSPENRLDASDAQYVQCLHTSWIGVGDTCGHANYDANDGINQPGCGSIVGNHLRSVQIFIYSLNPIYQFEAARCQLNPPIRGILMRLPVFVSSARPPCVPIGNDRYGIHSRKIHGHFQFITSNHPPHALGHVEVSRRFDIVE